MMFMKRTIILFVITCFSLTVSAQDTIFTKRGQVIPAKILEVSETNVSYKKQAYQDGPTFVIEKNKVAKIIFGNGTIDTFRDPSAYAAMDYYGYGRKIFSFNPAELFVGNVSFSVEMLTRNARFGCRVPIYFPMSKHSLNKMGVDVDFKFYLNKNDYAKYYLGPSISGNIMHEGYYDFGVMLDNGFSFQPYKKFNITLDFAAGMAHSDRPDTSPYLDVFIWRAGIIFGLRPHSQTFSFTGN
jgi:hypothetical protein